MDIKSKKGVTLVEVVVAVAIMAIIIIPISLVFTTAYSNFIRESDKVTAQSSAREVLYGKGMGSYGVMGDLERSNATSGDIVLENRSYPDKYRSIKIKEYITDAITSVTSVVVHKYSFSGTVLKYEVSSPASSGNYFENEKSSSDHDVKVTDFVCEKVNEVPDPATGTQKETDTDMIKITVSVECGRSGKITLQSSYRIPNIERP